MARYDSIYKFMTEKLGAELPKQLTYHSLDHILDVLHASVEIAELENLSSDETELLKTAVLFHDAGFVKSGKGHEETGCRMAEEILPRFAFDPEEIGIIKGMIMATKYPPAPKTLSEKIICDADLDYLGRDDFFEIGNKLFRELLSQGSVANEKEWNNLQVNFLTTHRYFTEGSKKLREEKKKLHLKEVRRLVMASGGHL